MDILYVWLFFCLCANFINYYNTKYIKMRFSFLDICIKKWKIIYKIYKNCRLILFFYNLCAKGIAKQDK